MLKTNPGARPVNAHFKSTIMKAYETHWKQSGRQGIYKTKSLTQFHKDIHTNPKTEYAMTVETDSTIKFAFGLHSEVLAITSKKNPNKNQSFK